MSPIFLSCYSHGFHKLFSLFCLTFTVCAWCHCSLGVIPLHIFYFDVTQEPPVFGKMTLFTSRSSGLVHGATFLSIELEILCYLIYCIPSLFSVSSLHIYGHINCKFISFNETICMIDNQNGSSFEINNQLCFCVTSFSWSSGRKLDYGLYLA